jgi:hypothetical protein
MTAQPPGPPDAGPPVAVGPPPPPPRDGANRSKRAVLIVLLVLVLGLGAFAAVIALSGDDKASASDITLEQISSTGSNPFITSVGTDEADVTPPPKSGGSFPGGTEGLYGGTRDEASCNADQLVTFLEGNPDKAAAWAGVLGIRTAEIRSYVKDLTPVILRSDVSVTNHGYVNGHATSIPAVLQAGTAVLVDKYGTPVTKCFCGNPLTPPHSYSTPTYTGRRWRGFTPNNLTVVVKNTTVIDTFVLIDPKTFQRFNRPRGGDGSTDLVNPFPEPGTTSTSRPSTSTTSSPTSNALDGTYSFTSTIVSGPSQQCGTGKTGDLTVTVTGTGSNRQVRLGTGTFAFSGALTKANSFTGLSAPLQTGNGTETISGMFRTAGSTVTLAGDDAIVSGGVTCKATYTATKG